VHSSGQYWREENEGYKLVVWVCNSPHTVTECPEPYRTKGCRIVKKDDIDFCPHITPSEMWNETPEFRIWLKKMGLLI